MKKSFAWKRLEMPIALIFFLIFIGFSLLSNAFLFAVTYRASSDALLDSALFYTERITAQASANLDEYIREYELLITALSRNPHLIRRITENDSLTMEEKLYCEKQCMVYLNHIMSSKTGTAGILIVGANGYVYNEDARANLNTQYDFAHADWFADALSFDETDMLNISAIQVDFYQRNTALYGKCVTTLSYCIRNYTNEKIGVICVFLDTSDLKSSLYLDNFNEFGGVFLINQQQEIVLHRDEAMLNQVLEGPLLQSGDATQRLEAAMLSAGSQSVWVRFPSEYVKADAVCSISLDGISARTRAYQQPLLASSAVSLLGVFACGLMLFLLFHRGTDRMMADIIVAKSEPTAYRPKNYHIRELNAIARQFSLLLDSLMRLDRKNYDMQVANQLAQINALMAQINPHFLFNALQLLQTDLVCGDRESADEVIVNLSDLLRYSIDNQNTFVRLADELAFVRSYIDVFGREYTGRLRYDIFCPEELLELQIPKFLIQPLVENSIRHGFAKRTDSMTITITASECFNSVALSVIDNGCGIPAEQLEAVRRELQEGSEPSGGLRGVGLQNICHRLRLLYGNRFALNLSSVAGSYTKIDVLIPKEAAHEITDRG